MKNSIISVTGIVSRSLNPTHRMKTTFYLVIEILGIIRAYRHAKRVAKNIDDPENNICQTVGEVKISGRWYQIQIHLVVDKKQWQGDGKRRASSKFMLNDPHCRKPTP